MSYLEPVYLNEKMLLNCAAYAFKGVSMETEISEGKSTKAKGNIALGFKFLTDLLSPVSASADVERAIEFSSKTARRYTLGGLHMTLIDSLTQDGLIKKISDDNLQSPSEDFVQLNVILKPVDLFAIIEALKISTPLTSQFLQNFGERINPNVFNKSFQKDLPKYEELLSNVLSKLEEDYLTSRQMEMVMIDPDTDRQLGLVDIDVSEMDANQVKAKLTDGQFRVIGKVSRRIGAHENMSLVQRTMLSSIVELLEKISDAGGSREKYIAGIGAAREIVKKVCQLTLEGPAVRVIPLSICI